MEGGRRKGEFCSLEEKRTQIPENRVSKLISRVKTLALDLLSNMENSHLIFFPLGWKVVLRGLMERTSIICG